MENGTTSPRCHYFLQYAVDAFYSFFPFLHSTCHRCTTPQPHYNCQGLALQCYLFRTLVVAAFASMHVGVWALQVLVLEVVW